MAKNLRVYLFTITIAVIPFFLQAQNKNNELWDSETLYVSNIYPNPAVNIITLDYRVLEANTQASIIIRNVIGSEMGTVKLNESETTINLQLDNFSSGIYFYTLRIDGKETVTKKFMVNR